MTNSRAPRAVILSGAGRYADPWHPFASTSARLDEILRAEGLETEIATDIDGQLADLSGCDLLVLNIGAPDGGPPTGPTSGMLDIDARSRRGLLAYLAAGKPILAVHATLTSLGFIPEWESIIGGIWVRGTTMHPPFGRASISVASHENPIITGIKDFIVLDERYTHLRVSDEIEVLAWHTLEEARHPVLWAKVYGSARIVVDALGHDTRTYESPIHRRLLARAVRWLVSPPQSTA